MLHGALDSWPGPACNTVHVTKIEPTADPSARRSEVVEVDPRDPSPDTIERAAALLVAGGLVAFPTETVYGLGAYAFDPAAVHAVFAGKGRPPTDPLIVHLSHTDLVASVVSDWPERAARLAERFWPGPLTMVLPRSVDVPDSITAGRDTVAVRVPSHPVTHALLHAAQGPVAAPSANRFGRISPTTAAHVISELHGAYDLLLDGGPTPLGVESTVVDLSGDVAAMLRPGGVTLEDLIDELGRVDHVERRAGDESVDAAAPGQFLRHYSPRTPLVMVEGPHTLAGQLSEALEDRGTRAQVVELSEDPDRAAHELYSALRRCDAGSADLLLVGVVAPHGLGRAVNDRLYRAAHGRVVLDASTGTLARLAAFAAA